MSGADASQAAQGAVHGSYFCARCLAPVQPYREPQPGAHVFCRAPRTCREEFWREARKVGAAAQLGLALVNPIARTTDPVTSHIAAEAVTESGSRASHCALVLGVLAVAGRPMTYREVAVRLPNLEAVEVMRRLNDLRHETPARVVQLDKRECRVSGRPAVTWAVAGRAVVETAA